eukprot:CAMPEP_0177626874 /NCGR_PEP_ID=MMETSP0419_2-20121207/30896_1 /TAXON_ID=582737 /ORGANISM="Tetraselmis sp., Strain GSL018" /LENGTH=48 /DNA_ID= /DNA_START= /DNA_END= /DNA_ORIENTATION=
MTNEDSSQRHVTFGCGGWSMEAAGPSREMVSSQIVPSREMVRLSDLRG